MVVRCRLLLLSLLFVVVSPTVSVLGTSVSARDDFPLRKLMPFTYVVDYEPFWSPDGRQIVLISNRHGGMKVHIMDANSGAHGSDMRQLTSGEAEDDSPAWSPDGKKIAFVSVRGGGSQILVMNADGSEVRQVTNDTSENVHPTWSADSSRILFNTTHFASAGQSTDKGSGAEGDLSIERMCRLAEVSRAGFYRSFQADIPSEDELELRSAVQEIVLEHRQRYGYRRVAAEVRRRGIIANHKRVARIMREDNLLGMRPLRPPRKSELRRSVRGLSESCGPHEGDGYESTVGSRYHIHSIEKGIRLPSGDSGLVFAQSRGLGTGSNARHPLAASSIEAGDRGKAAVIGFGTPFGSRRAVYVERLQKSSAEAWDVPQYKQAEDSPRQRELRKLYKNSQTEEIRVGIFQSLEDLRTNIETFIEQYYNGPRLHSALGYRPPGEFEKAADSCGTALASSGAILNILNINI